MCFWRPVGVRAGEVGAPLEFTSGSSWAGKGRLHDPWYPDELHGSGRIA